MTRLAALLLAANREVLGHPEDTDEAAEADWHAEVAERLIAQGVRVPTEAGASVGDDGLRKVLYDVAAVHYYDGSQHMNSDPTCPLCKALRPLIEAENSAALAAPPAPNDADYMGTLAEPVFGEKTEP